MRRRHLLQTIWMAPLLLRAAPVNLRGRLGSSADGTPTLTPTDGRPMSLRGDQPTVGVLKDSRLQGLEFEVKGQPAGPQQFTIDPIHTKSMLAYRDGKPYQVTYWCEVCYIRTYTPGKCWCCQDETRLDLRPPEDK